MPGLRINEIQTIFSCFLFPSFSFSCTSTDLSPKLVPLLIQLLLQNTLISPRWDLDIGQGSLGVHWNLIYPLDEAESQICGCPAI